MFDSWRDPTEMASVTCGYVNKLGSAEVRLAVCGDYIWVRLAADDEVATLLFQRPDAGPQQPASSPEYDSFARPIVG